jgi:hypothetical protein
MAKKIDSRTRGSSPADSARSTEGSCHGEYPAFPHLARLLTHLILDPIILSDDESIGAESETDYSNLNVDVTAKSASHSPHIADSDLVDGGGFSSGTTLTSARLIADYPNHGNDNDKYVVDSAEPQLTADRPSSASSSHGSVAHQASPVQANTEITQVSASNINLDVTQGVEDEGIDVFTKGNDPIGADTHSTKRSRPSAISYNNSASSSNVSISEVQDGQHSSTQSSQLGPAVASLQQSDLTNDPLPKHRYRQDATRNIYRKRSRTPATTRPASTVSTALESTELEEHQSHALATALGEERKIRDIDQEMVSNGSTDNSSGKDCCDVSDAAGSEIGGRPRSRKRARRTKTQVNNMETPSTPSLDVSYQAIAATSSGDMQESEEIPIHGFFTMKMIKSKVVYCLTFSQALSPCHRDPGHRQDSRTNLEEPQLAAPAADDPNHEWGIRETICQKMVGHERYDMKQPLKRGRPATGQPDAQDGEELKKRRGQPRKQLPKQGQPDAQGREEPKKRRGRPRKQLPKQGQPDAQGREEPKKRRGRPRKQK